jgi:hypothetical protein
MSQFKTNVALRALLMILVVLTISCRGKGTTQIAEFPEQEHRKAGILNLLKI